LPASDGEVLTRAVTGKLPPLATRDIRILVVDDNVDAAETVTLLLQSANYQARSAPDAEAALRIIEFWPPELAILDIGLPGMNGYELASRLRQDPRSVDMKLIALTGYGRDSDRERALKAGFDVHLPKPADAAQLLEHVARLVAHSDPALKEAGGR